MARVNRSVPFANGELLFCELPDGTRGTLTAWMTNAARTPLLMTFMKRAARVNSFQLAHGITQTRRAVYA